MKKTIHRIFGRLEGRLEKLQDIDKVNIYTAINKIEEDLENNFNTRDEDTEKMYSEREKELSLYAFAESWYSCGTYDYSMKILEDPFKLAWRLLLHSFLFWLQCNVIGKIVDKTGDYPQLKQG